ncbi:outer membrane protein, adhesin transport system [Roseivivax lentus]|uniref:Outer membrane protein, adhesin transport system n=1 Tax=Roseivivax lentus TaxID=633194 RepID=A0A1N7M8D7_9RHOB|nr:TolC family protein [Roseivivax lentus]SIS82386.1 outer membrane protein, adhesin transport system [Roseivivax lentus]
MRASATAIILGGALLGLAGCGGTPFPAMPGMSGLSDLTTRFATGPDAAMRRLAPETDGTSATGAQDRDRSDAASPIIAELATRRSVLEPGSPYAEIAGRVLASGARVEAAELEVAQLRARAADWNWLPTLGPTVSLSALGDVVADLVLNQVLFDNGRKRAERDLARAEVERAAVRLSDSTNARVADALRLQIRAAEGRETATHFAAAHKDMAHFEWVMSERVKGGVSNRSDLVVLRQKLADIAADRDRATEDAARAEAELAQMADGAGNIRGIGTLSGPVADATPLGVLMARADRDKTEAEARIARSGFLPGLGFEASARSGQGGLTAALPNGVGIGTGAALKATEASITAAEERILAAREEAAREEAGLLREIAALERQVAEAQDLARQAKTTLDLFQRQYEGGQRRVMEVVGVYETFADATARALRLKYDHARAEVALARLRGVLADGAAI